MDLFEAASKHTFEPLASRMRPRTIDEFVGQEHILGKGRLLRRAIQLDQLSSLVFWGPPGTGKTTLARVIANTTKSRFTTLNAVLAGVQEVRETVAEAKRERDYHDLRTILFVDEVHRWNKAQQDALLPWVENGTVIFIGATTENPYFKVNSALLSRSRVFQLVPLSPEDLRRVAQAALSDAERGYGKYKVRIDEDALDHLIQVADGDARSLLNALELAVETTPNRFPPPLDEEIRISLATAEESIQKKVVLYDREGDYHYDAISAFIKSLRGSDPDAAFYWLARMVAAGEDPAFLFRRMLIFASEDVGMADPNALVVVEAAASAFDRVGLPEGRFHLAHAALYLATASKSNSTLGFFDALGVVQKERQQDVPRHLKDASRDKEGFGHGEGYLYPHAYKDHWVAQQYLPQGLRGRVFYKPSDTGREKEIKARVERNRDVQLEASASFDVPEILTFSADTKSSDLWLRRAQGALSARARDVRQRVFAPLVLARHHNVLDLAAGRGLLLMEALRRVPEGCVVGLVGEKADLEILSHSANQLDESERPQLVMQDLSAYTEADLPESFRGMRFEAIVGRNVWSRTGWQGSEAEKIVSLLAPGGRVSLAQHCARRGTRLSQSLGDLWPEGKVMLEKIESLLYGNPENPLVNWDAGMISDALEQAGLKMTANAVVEYADTRLILPQDLDRWFTRAPVPDGYGKRLRELCSEKERAAFLSRLKEILAGKEVKWTTAVFFIAGERIP